MESKYSKPSALPKPTLKGVSGKVSTLNNANFHLSRMPLAINLQQNGNAVIKSKLKRALSPDSVSKSTNVTRPKLRRSRSASDLREFTRPFKREQNLPTIPANPVKALHINVTKKENVSATTKGKNIISNSSISKSKTTLTSKSIVKRIPPYDYKARFNDLLEKHKILKEKYESKTEQLSALETLPDQFEESQNELYKRKEELKNLQIEIACLKKHQKNDCMKIDALTRSLQLAQESLITFTENCKILATENSEIKIELTELRELKIKLNSQMEIVTLELEKGKDQLFKANLERKDLHNVVMDLRGNIRVFCRVRPTLSFEEDKLICGWNFLDESSLEICSNEILPSGVKKTITKHDFSFDRVFHPKSTQEDIFDMVSPLIQSALDGYNVCIFAYGQTGSGKTYTMEGTENFLGITPRTVDLLFESVQNYKRLGWEYEIRVTFLEIYNEVLYDLLDNNKRDLEIRMVSAANKTDVYVSNITEEIVKNGSYLKKLMNIAKMNRATAATVGNERSSRSHAVTKIQLIGNHETKTETCIGTINLVDLAGSESPKTSVRMDETKKINRSLSELTNVILALLQKQEHIPYRNSKLTHLLMPCLGGNSKTLMFINVAPLQDCFVESVKSLRFAASVNSCKLMKTKKNKYLNIVAN